MRLEEETEKTFTTSLLRHSSMTTAYSAEAALAAKAGKAERHEVHEGGKRNPRINPGAKYSCLRAQAYRLRPN